MERNACEVFTQMFTKLGREKKMEVGERKELYLLSWNL